MAVGRTQFPGSGPRAAVHGIGEGHGASPLACVAEAPHHVLWVLELDPDERVVYVSPSFERVWGRPVEALHADARHWMEGVHPLDRPRVREAMDAWVADPDMEAYDVEFRVVRPDGAVRWLHDHGHAVWLPDGRLQLTGIAEDITDRRLAADALRRAHEELQRRHEQLTLVAAASPSVVHSVRRGADGRFTLLYGIERLAALYGVEPAALRADAGEALTGRIHPDDVPTLQASMGASLASLTPWLHAYRYQHPTRGELWLESHSTPVRSPDGAVVWHGTVTDVTDRHRQESAIRGMNAELERRVADRTADLQAAVHDLEAFGYSVSHDLRAPLRTVHGFVQLVLDDADSVLSERARRYLHLVQDGARGMGRLIDDLLAFSRLGRQAVTRHRVDTALLVRDALQALAAQHEGREVDLVLGPLPPSEGDPGMLRQVWINLLSNALKYTRGRHPARIEVGFADGAFFVRDNGAGFDMAQAGRLFQVFERLHAAAEHEGTGVGLAIVKRIVERHGGTVAAEGVPQGGATFRFTLGAGPHTPTAAVG